jgi:valyl-tRNA synthetase
MCCTFGDASDVRWWRTHELPLRGAVGRDGRLTALAGPYAGQTATEARAATLADLGKAGVILAQAQIEHALGTHERCSTPVEFLETRQWFVRILDHKQALLRAGQQVRWHPEHMRVRYEHWVEHLQWDWCISRQRYFGVPIPAWRCTACGSTVLAERTQLPVDPTSSRPLAACACGADSFVPDPSVLDTWATSSCTPLILAHWPDGPAPAATRLPFSLRPQAHDIIRTWAFYTIVQSLAHTGQLPWRDIMISGHGLSAQRQKLSKSRASTANDPSAGSPFELIERESADALRYWATSGRTGADSPFTPETLTTGRRLVTKLWNAGRFVAARLAGYAPEPAPLALLPTDRWLLARLTGVISRATHDLDEFEYAAARSTIERFFWSDLCDNYLELAKARLYGPETPEAQAARWTLYHAFLDILKLLAPYLPYITETLYQGIYRERETATSLHVAAWPEAPTSWSDHSAEELGNAIVEMLGDVRRYKTEADLSVGAELATLRITAPPLLIDAMRGCLTDLRSATRAQHIQLRRASAREGAAATRARVIVDQRSQPGKGNRDAAAQGASALP